MEPKWEPRSTIASALAAAAYMHIQAALLFAAFPRNNREALEHLPTLRRCRHVSLLLLFISELIRLGLGARFGPPMI